MKKFIEEYGFGILTAIVVIMLLCLSTPIGDTIGNSVKTLVNNFGEKTNCVMNVAGEATEQLANTLKGESIGGGSGSGDSIEYLSIGGKVFLDNGDNSATYKFYDSGKNEIVYTNLSSLDSAVYYTVEGTPASDRFYVVAVDSSQADYDSTFGVNLGTLTCWGYDYITTSATTNSIGSGKTNTAKVLAIKDTSSCAPYSIWEWLNDVNSNEYGGCNDWFIGSKAEYDTLNSSGKVELLFGSKSLLSSIELASDRAYFWDRNIGDWNDAGKSGYINVIAFRSF